MKARVRASFRSPRLPSGWYRIYTGRSSMQGHGDGDFIRLRDEFGRLWTGMAWRELDDSVRYRFRDSEGRSVQGISDSHGMMLRDDKGRTWRGFID